MQLSLLSSEHGHMDMGIEVQDVVVIRHVSPQPIEPIVSNESGLLMHREGAQVAGVVIRLSTTLTCGV